MTHARTIAAILGAAAAGSAPVAMAAVASASASAVPVLGSAHAFPAGTGFGIVKPRTVFLGGDPTGDFTKLRWTGWGRASSTGKGDGFYVPPGAMTAGAVRVPVILTASSQGQCSGHLAYRRLAVTFVYKHRDEKGSTLSICS